MGVVNNSVQLLHSKPDRDLRAGQEGTREEAMIRQPTSTGSTIVLARLTLFDHLGEQM